MDTGVSRILDIVWVGVATMRFVVCDRVSREEESKKKTISHLSLYERTILFSYARILIL